MKTKELIIKYLTLGNTQKEISEIFKQKGLKPNSLSTIEKYLKAIRKEYGAKTTFHLGVILNNRK